MIATLCCESKPQARGLAWKKRSVLETQTSTSRRNPHLRTRESTKSPITVPVSLWSAVECYACREVPLNYSDSLLFHGGDTGSTAVRDANTLKHLQDPPGYSVADAFVSGWTNQNLLWHW